MTLKNRGIVFGALLGPESREIDMSTMHVVRQQSSGMKLTFHRAFDVIGSGDDDSNDENLQNIMESIIAIGCDRVLTSGRSISAEFGVSTLRTIVKISSGRIEIIAAAGVNAQNVTAIIKESGVDGVHVGSSVTNIEDSSPTAKAVFSGAANSICGGDMFVWHCVCESKVKNLLQRAVEGWDFIT